jgi:hypothetical protein
MRPSRRSALLTILLIAAAAAFSACTPAPTADPKVRAEQIAGQVMDALGGQRAWDALPGLRWSFGVSQNDTIRSERRHSWNKQTGQHRVEGVNRAGQKFVIFHAVGDTTQGRAWVDGVAIEGDSLHKLVKRAEALWINDTYWMLMPYKLRDPGVTLTWAGDTTIDQHTFDRLALSFANVGMTPGDQYWVWVDRLDRRVKRWDMVLEGDVPPPATYTWEDWAQTDGLWFPASHRKDATNIFTNKVEVVREFAATEFEQP